MMSNDTIVQYYGGNENEGHRCGYCKSPNGNYSKGMWAYRMTVQDYQDLLDRGWRRSGQYCYKPTMDRTCCPHYTIRCDVNSFRLSKSQKKVLRLVNRYLNHGTKPKQGDGSGSGSRHESSEHQEHHECFVAAPREPSDLPEHVQDSLLVQKKNVSHPVNHSRDSSNIAPSQDQDGSSSSQEAENKACRPGSGADPSLPPCKKKKQLRREKYIQKHGQLNPKEQNEGKSLADFLSETVEKPAHKLELELVRSSPESEVFIERFQLCHAVYKRYQMSVHHDPEDKPNTKQYSRFLVKCPLQPKPGTDPSFAGYGAFHQHYILDGKIIAVAVLDILPYCVSAKYFYYDPDYSFMKLGTYSALREIALVQELHQMQEQLKYYYMGFYIHSCPKMRYKGQYAGSYLLCPESYHWVPIEDCRKKLDENKYSRLADPACEDANGDIDVNEVPLLLSRKVVPYGLLKTLIGDGYEDDIREYAQLAGKTCAERMFLLHTG